MIGFDVHRNARAKDCKPIKKLGTNAFWTRATPESRFLINQSYTRMKTLFLPITHQNERFEPITHQNERFGPITHQNEKDFDTVQAPDWTSLNQSNTMDSRTLSCYITYYLRAGIIFRNKNTGRVIVRQPAPIPVWDCRQFLFVVSSQNAANRNLWPPPQAQLVGVERQQQQHYSVVAVLPWAKQSGTESMQKDRVLYRFLFLFLNLFLPIARRRTRTCYEGEHFRQKYFLKDGWVFSN